ncbi:MAG: hypothetical protein ACRD1B_00825, partial [Thermoanaerobaculia bacterium]
VRVLDNLSTGRLENLAGSPDRIEFLEGDVREIEDFRGCGLTCKCCTKLGRSGARRSTGSR